MIQPSYVSANSRQPTRAGAENGGMVQGRLSAKFGWDGVKRTGTCSRRSYRRPFRVKSLLQCDMPKKNRKRTNTGAFITRNVLETVLSKSPILHHTHHVVATKKTWVPSSSLGVDFDLLGMH